MDLEKELQKIDKFFDEKTEEEVLEMLTECGNERILPTKEIAKRQEKILKSVLKSM